MRFNWTDNVVMRAIGKIGDMICLNHNHRSVHHSAVYGNAEAGEERRRIHYPGIFQII